jgi:hypothetical protein
MEVRLDQPRHDRPASGVDSRGARLDLGRSGRATRVDDSPVLYHDRGVRQRGSARSVNELPA